jgi:hypothetical protein
MQVEPMEDRLALSTTSVSTFRQLTFTLDGVYNGKATLGSFVDKYSANVHVTGKITFTSPTVGTIDAQVSGSGTGTDDQGAYSFQILGPYKGTVNDGALGLTSFSVTRNIFSRGDTQKITIGPDPSAGSFRSQNFATYINFSSVVSGATVSGSMATTFKETSIAPTDFVAAAVKTTTGVEFDVNTTGRFLRPATMGTIVSTGAAYWSSTPDMSGAITTVKLPAVPMNLYWNTGTLKFNTDALGQPPAGAKYVVFRVDPTNKVVESNESNNVAFVPTNIIPNAAFHFDSKLALTVTPTTAPRGTEIALTAAVTPVAPATAVPTGSVAFYDGATLLGTIPLYRGTATLKIKTLTAGTHSVSAKYLGSALFDLSSAPAKTVTVT